VRYLARFNPAYLWATRTFGFAALAILVGGFVALRWWPWWVTLLAAFISVSLYRGTKLSCADAVRDIMANHPEVGPTLMQAGVIRPDEPVRGISRRS